MATKYLVDEEVKILVTLSFTKFLFLGNRKDWLEHEDQNLRTIFECATIDHFSAIQSQSTKRCIEL